MGAGALFYYSGAEHPVPPALAGERIYLFPRTRGYDGQIYHYIAHDPFFERGFADYIDAPRLRYRRILLPMAAHLAALGSDAWVDFVYRLLVLAFVFLGTYWVSGYAVAAGRHPAWGLGFVLLPAVVVSAERLTVDVALVALCAGFGLYVRTAAHRKLYAVLALSALARETGLLLALAVLIDALQRRKLGRAALYSTALLPCLGWYAFVQLHTQDYAYPGSLVPLSGIVSAFREPLLYPGDAGGRGLAPALATMVRQTLERSALIGIVIAFALSVVGFLRRPSSPVWLAALLFTLLGTLVQRAENWAHVYDFGRVHSPLLLLLGLEALASRAWLPALPLLLMWPRLFWQLRGPLARILKGLLSS